MDAQQKHRAQPCAHDVISGVAVVLHCVLPVSLGIGDTPIYFNMHARNQSNDFSLACQLRIRCHPTSCGIAVATIWEVVHMVRIGIAWNVNYKTIYHYSFIRFFKKRITSLSMKENEEIKTQTFPLHASSGDICLIEWWCLQVYAAGIVMIM